MKERLVIYSPDGTEFLEGEVVEQFSYTARRMGDAVITFSLRYPECLDSRWTGSEYVIFRGVRHILRSVPSSSRENTDRRWAHQCEFVDIRSSVLGNVYFYDIVSPDSGDSLFRTGSSSVRFYGDLREFVSRINSVMAYRDLGYTCSLDSTVGDTEKLYVSFDDRTLFEVLQESYALWEVPFYFVGNDCRFGSGADYTPSEVLEYGHDAQLLSMSKRNQNAAIITRITGRGSSDNIPWYYPNPTAKGVVGVDAEGSLPASAFRIVDRVRFSDGLPTGERVVWTEDTFGFTLYKSLPDDLSYTNPDVNVFGFANMGIRKRSLTLNLYFGYTPDRDEVFVPCLHIEPKEVVTAAQSTSGGLINFAYGNLDQYVLVDSVICWNSSGTTFDAPLEQMRTVTLFESYGRMLEKRYRDYSTYTGMDLTFPQWQLKAGEATKFFFSIRLSVPMNLYEGPPIGNDKGRNPLDVDGKLSVKVLNNQSLYYWNRRGVRIIPERIGLQITGSPRPGDAFWQTAADRVECSGALMPSIWRRTGFHERFYNAVSAGYKLGDVQIGPWGIEFPNEYDPDFPREFIKDFDDVKPSITGHLNAAGQRIAEVLDTFYEPGYDPTILEEDGSIRKFSRFFVRLRRMDGTHPFNLFECAIDEDAMTLSMTSGKCGGCEFAVQVDELGRNCVQVDDNGRILTDRNTGRVLFGAPQQSQNDTSSNEVWICLALDETTYGGDINDEFIMPSRTFRVSAGDSFVILHILLPDAFILEAEDELERRLIDYMAQNNAQKWSFDMKLSRVWLAQHPEVLVSLNENSSVKSRYDGVDLPLLYVTSYTYKVTSDALPEVSIELKDTVEVNQGGLDRKIQEVVTDTIKISGGVGSSTTGSASLGDLSNVDNSADISGDAQTILFREAGSSRWRSGTVQDVLGITPDGLAIMAEKISRMEGGESISGHWKGDIASEEDISADGREGDMYRLTESSEISGVLTPAGTVLVEVPGVEGERHLSSLMTDWKAPSDGITIGDARLSDMGSSLESSKPFYSHGEVCAFGIGEPRSGVVGGLLTEWNYTADKIDYALGASLGNELHIGLQTLSSRVDSIASRTTQVSWTSGLSSGLQIGQLKVDGTTYTLYAPNPDLSQYLRISDISAWALEPSKPSYSFSEITGKVSSQQIENPTITIGATQVPLGGEADTLTLNNGSSLQWKNSGGAPVALLGFSSHLLVGNSGSETVVQGSRISFRRGEDEYISVGDDARIDFHHPIMIGGASPRLCFGNAADYIEKKSDMLHSPMGFYTEGEITAYGTGEADDDYGKSIGTLANVTSDADSGVSRNTILVKSSGNQSWRMVALDDVLVTGMLTRAEVASSDSQGNSGVYLKMTFTTGDVVYANLSSMTDATMQALFEKVEAMESRIVFDSEQNIRELYESGRLDANKIYYGYE